MNITNFSKHIGRSHTYSMAKVRRKINEHILVKGKDYTEGDCNHDVKIDLTDSGVNKMLDFVDVK